MKSVVRHLLRYHRRRLDPRARRGAVARMRLPPCRDGNVVPCVCRAPGLLPLKLQVIALVEGPHALGLAYRPIPHPTMRSVENVAAVVVPRPRGTVAAPGEDPRHHLCEGGPEGREARSEDGCAYFEERPVCCVDVVPVRVLGSVRGLERGDPDGGDDTGTGTDTG